MYPQNLDLLIVNLRDGYSLFKCYALGFSILPNSFVKRINLLSEIHCPLKNKISSIRSMALLGNFFTFLCGILHGSLEHPISRNQPLEGVSNKHKSECILYAFSNCIHVKIWVPRIRVGR